VTGPFGEKQAISVIVAENSGKISLQIAQRNQRKRGSEIPGVQNEGNFSPVEKRNSLLHIFHFVMGIRHHSDKHPKSSF
jgi:hypothetical protein